MQTARKETVAARTMRTYEVQRHVQGRWSVESVADNKEIAIELAKALMHGKRPPSSVRVMSVETKADGAFSEVSVFRAGMGEQKTTEAAPKPKIEVKPAAKTEMRDFKHVEPPPQVPKKRGGFSNVLRAVGFAFGIGTIIVIVQLLFHLMR